MSLKLVIKNFQSIEEARFVFEEGVTLITGPNGSGKTAVFRALYCLLMNDNKARHYIKVGKNKSIVEAQLDSKPPVAWIRSAKTIQYRIGKEKFEKCGRTNLVELLDDSYGFVIYSGDVINIHSEHKSLFPFYLSDTELFRVFEDIFSISDSNLVLKTIIEDDRDLDKKIKLKKEKRDSVINKMAYIDLFFNEVQVDKIKSFQQNIIDCWYLFCNLSHDIKKLNSDSIQLEMITSLKKEEFDFSSFDKLQELEVDINKIKYYDLVLSRMELEDRFIDLKSFDVFIEFEKDFNKLLNLEAEIKKLEIETITGNINLNAIIEEWNSVPNCPLCGSFLSKDTLINNIV